MFQSFELSNSLLIVWLRLFWTQYSLFSLDPIMSPISAPIVTSTFQYWTYSMVCFFSAIEKKIRKKTSKLGRKNVGSGSSDSAVASSELYEELTAYITQQELSDTQEARSFFNGILSSIFVIFINHFPMFLEFVTWIRALILEIYCRVPQIRHWIRWFVPEFVQFWSKI